LGLKYQVLLDDLYRENSMSEAISATSSFHLIGTDVERLERSPPRTHRAWSPDLKARIIEETFAPGANVSAIARSHDLAPSQLFAWRRKAQSTTLVWRSAADRRRLLPIA
jgi:transposase